MALVLLIVLPIRYFLIQPFFVDGASMEPNFDNGQYLIIDELSYRLRPVERGEVIVFRPPLNPASFYIKRVIGLPGESVEITDSRVEIFNKDHPLGFVLNESAYLSSGAFMADMKKQSLGPNDFFVMGDNRQASSDSRYWGSVPRQNIIGRVWLRAWPLATAKAFEAPQYTY